MSQSQFFFKEIYGDFLITNQEEFIAMITDSSLTTVFDTIQVTDLWCSNSIVGEYQFLAKKAAQTILSFTSKYLCTTRFLSYT